MVVRVLEECRLVELVAVLRGNMAAPQAGPAGRVVGNSADGEARRLGLRTNLSEPRGVSALHQIGSVAKRNDSETRNGSHLGARWNPAQVDDEIEVEVPNLPEGVDRI